MLFESLYISIVFYLILAYLLGSIPTSVWVGKIFYKTDVRLHGSGNAGATNTIRVLGLKAGIPVLLFDVFKGWLAVFIGKTVQLPIISKEYEALFLVILAVFVVLGHVFPVFAGFKGGKGVATLLGIAIALFPLEVAILLCVFIVVFMLTKYVSLASIIASVLFPIILIFLTGNTQLSYLAFSLIVAVFVPLTHRKNIKRLFRGEEKKMLFRKKSD